MRAASITVSQEEVLINLDMLQSAIADVPDMLAIIGQHMLNSVARTFRDQGSPAGIWPELAESTKKKKGYTAAHKLLIMRGLLFGSIKYQVSGGSVFIGSPLSYARVHQYGSLDRLGGSTGPQAKIAGRGVNVPAHDYLKLQTFRRYGKDVRNGRTVRVRAQGPANRIKVSVAEHERHQNIPARPYLVFRPEDPSNIELAIAGYVLAKAPRALSGSIRDRAVSS